MNQYDPSGKIQRVSNGALMSPGACFSCGSASHPVYALIGHTEWEGSVYLCESCALQVMTVFETLMLPANEKLLREQIYSLERDNNSLRASIRKLEKDNESYRLVFSRAASAVSGSIAASGTPNPVVVNYDKPSVERSEGITVSDSEPNPRHVPTSNSQVQRILDSANANVPELSNASSGQSTEQSDSPVNRDASEAEGIDRASSEAPGSTSESVASERSVQRTSSRRENSVGSVSALGVI